MREERGEVKRGDKERSREDTGGTARSKWLEVISRLPRN